MASETTFPALGDILNRWTVADSAELYGVDRWGSSYFSVHADGNLHVHPHGSPERSFDLKQLVDRLRLRGLELPILIRFNDILLDRMSCIQQAFQTAIRAHEYCGSYTCIYPIKVNQQRQVVEQIVRGAQDFSFGLEAGSKPELWAVVAMADNDTPIVCNGFKDAEFVEMVLLAHKLGRTIIPVVERYRELGIIIEAARRLGIQPQIGIRMKLATRGSGRWESSGGIHSKFGLSAAEIMRVVDDLRAVDMLGSLRMLHFHLGSQVTNIRHIQRALNEAARMYVNLVQLGVPLDTLDVGGGLGVDYDGSATSFSSSMNYTLQEYANDVIYHVQTVCDSVGIEPPHIFSESGRATVAHHCALVFEVVGETAPGGDQPLPPAREDVDPSLQILQETLKTASLRQATEAFHDAQQALDTVISLFSTGHMSLEERVRGETYFWAVCRKLRSMVATLDQVPEELEKLDRMLAHTYFCNFSLFQSMPDSWAIHQLFPIMPIHRLNEKPDQHVVLADITCDSDGKVDRFIDRRDIRRTLMLHQPDGQPYFVAAFLVGAYQEILGDLHNLFGDTNAVHVQLGPRGEVQLQSTIKGDTVEEVLQYVEYPAAELLERMQSTVELAVQTERVSHEEAGTYLQFYEAGLNGYTYLEDDRRS